MTKIERIEIFKEWMHDCIPSIISEDTIDKLQKMGFFSDALFDHSLEVMITLLDLTEKLDLAWRRPESPYLVGMFHDLCEIDNGRQTVGTPLITGHGEKSVILLQQIVNAPLTGEEELCIRWHMGAFDDKENWNRYRRAVSVYPNVLFTHTADMIAARIKNV